MELKNLTINSQSLGKMMLIKVSPAPDYVDGQRTDNITGYRYTVVLPDCGYDKLNIKITGQKLMDSPLSAIPVVFSDLKLGVYMSGNRPQVYAKATGIKMLKE